MRLQSFGSTVPGTRLIDQPEAKRAARKIPNRSTFFRALLFLCSYYSLCSLLLVKSSRVLMSFWVLRQALAEFRPGIWRFGAERNHDGYAVSWLYGKQSLLRRDFGAKPPSATERFVYRSGLLSDGSDGVGISRHT